MNLTPVHPMLVHFPIALTAAAFFFIILALIFRSDLLEKVAFANISLAAVSSIIAALLGVNDNIAYYGGGAPNYMVKINLSILLFLVTTITAIVRWRKPDIFHSRSKVAYVLAYGASFLLAFVLAYLGGIIVYG
jgi:uncharacterized membrane protein